MKKSQLRKIIKEEVSKVLEENTFDTLKNQAKTVKGFKDLNGKFKNRDGFSLTFRNGQRTIEFSPSSLKDNVSYTYDYEGNTGSDVISIKNAHKLINNISKKIIKEEISKVLSEEDNIRGATEDDPFYATQVGRNTGVRLNMRAILKLLKDQGYPHSIHRGNLLFPVEILAGGRGRDVGAITITKNGELFGPGSWGIEIKSEEEVIPAIEQFVKDQQNK